MKPHIIVQGSSLKYAELPPYPEVNDSVGFNAYQEAIESAIEVHPESVEFAKSLINKSNRKPSLYDINDGIYPIEAKVRIEMLWNTETQDWQEVAFIEPIEKHMPVGDTMQDQMMTVLHSFGLNPIKTSKKVMTDREESSNPFTKIMVEIKGAAIVNITDLPKEKYEYFLELTHKLRLAYIAIKPLDK